MSTLPPAPFPDRLKKGLLGVDAQPPADWEAGVLAEFRRSLERTLARLEPGAPSAEATFRFQLTGGRPLLLQGNEALPMEPSLLCRLLNTLEVELQSGEFLDVDGGLVAKMIRPEVTLTDSNLRHAEDTLRTLKSARERDNPACQSAESIKIRLRSRLTLLVGALQTAQRESPSSA